MSFTKINHYEKEYADTHHDTALNVTEGVEDQPIVSPYFTRRKKRRLSTSVMACDRVVMLPARMPSTYSSVESLRFLRRVK